MDKIHGLATIKRNGNNIIVNADAKLKIGGKSNNVQIVGYQSFRSEKITPSELEIKIPHTAKTDLVREQAMAGVEIQFHSDTGAVYVVASAAQTGEVDSGEEGLVTLTYTGDPAVKA